MNGNTCITVYFFLIFLFFSGDLVFGQDRTGTENRVTLDLGILLDEVGTANPTLHAARLEAEALGQRSAQISALPDPMIMVTYQPFPILTARGSQRSIWRLEQKIPFPGKRSLRGTIADRTADIAWSEADSYQQDLSYHVKQTYYELFRIQEQVRIIQTFQERLESFEEAAATQYEVGTGLQQDILKAQLERNALTQTMLSLEESRRTAVETLARLLNRPMDEALMAEYRVGIPELPDIDGPDLLSVALLNRPEWDRIETAVRRAETKISLARKEYLPDFSISATYFDIGSADTPASATGRDAAGIGLSISVPLQRGRLNAQLEEARLGHAQVEARKEALLTSFQTNIADLWDRLHREEAQRALYLESLIPQAETTLAASLSAYMTGRTSFLNLLDAERMLFSLRTGYQDILARYLFTSAALERALGITTLENLLFQNQ